MSYADTADAVLDDLAKVLNRLREDNIQTANSLPGNDAARQSKWEAVGVLRILNVIADEMDIKTVTTYSVR